MLHKAMCLNVLQALKTFTGRVACDGDGKRSLWIFKEGSA